MTKRSISHLAILSASTNCLQDGRFSCVRSSDDKDAKSLALGAEHYSLIVRIHAHGGGAKLEVWAQTRVTRVTMSSAASNSVHPTSFLKIHKRKTVRYKLIDSGSSDSKSLLRTSVHHCAGCSQKLFGLT
jgi:hypothetical protein